MNSDWHTHQTDSNSVRYVDSPLTADHLIAFQGGRTGLSNIGNTCYMNIALQVLLLLVVDCSACLIASS